MKYSALCVSLATLLATHSSFAHHTKHSGFMNTKHFGKHLCQHPDFYCTKVKRGQTWAGLFSNPYQRDIVMRLNRTNVALKHRPWIVIPRNLSSLHVMDLSPFPEKINAPGERVIMVSLNQQAFAAYNSQGYLVTWGPASGAKGYCPDVGRSCSTALGSYKMLRKKGAWCKSGKYPISTGGGSPMPYCMFYYKGFAMHGSTLPGFHASHGCIRLFKEDAEWLNKGFVSVGKNGTRVIVRKGVDPSSRYADLDHTSTHDDQL